VLRRGSGVRINAVSDGFRAYYAPASPASSHLDGLDRFTDSNHLIATPCISLQEWARCLHEGRRESPKEGEKVEYLKKTQPQEEGVTQKIRDAVSEILSAVEKEGIAAVRRYSEQLDNWNPESFVVSEERR
jgi:Histidinol dehydrogenase